jgi:hypothetical protein
MFVSGGCGPGWGGIKPANCCQLPQDAWSYSFKDNQWTLLDSGAGVPRGVDSVHTAAFCYDSKRDVVWGYGDSGLSRFDPKTKAWTTRPVKGKGSANYRTSGMQTEYLAKSDLILAISTAGGTFTINPETAEDELHAQPKPGEILWGAGGLAYLEDQNVALYVALTHEPKKYRAAVFDCATRTWHEWTTVNMPANAKERGAGGEVTVWDKLQYDPVDKVALLVHNDGVWAFKPPREFRFDDKPAAAGK